MKTLTGNMTTKKNALSQEPINILKIVFGGAVGTKYYSDRALTSPVTAEGRVVDWGSFTKNIGDAVDVNITSDIRIVMADADKVLYGYLSQVDFQRCRTYLYQWESTLVLGDMIPLIDGVIYGPVGWEEDTATISFDITDIAGFRERTLGTVATVDDFPAIAQDDENKVIPIVYGHVKRSHSVQIEGRASTTTAAGTRKTATELAVVDGSRFAQDVTIECYLGDELIDGVMHGNKFTIDNRSMVIYSGTTTHMGGSINEIIDTTMDDPKEYYHYIAQVQTPDNVWHTRHIYRVKESLSAVYIGAIRFGGTWWIIPAGTPWKVQCPAQNHSAGTPFYENTEYVSWIINEYPSEEVTGIEAWGYKQKAVVIQRWNRELGQMEDYELIKEYEGWVAFDYEEYEVNLDDDSFLGQFGHNCTTVKMWRNPADMPERGFKDNVLRPTLKGIIGIGTTPDSTVDIVEDICLRFLDMTPADIHAASFAAAAVDSTWIKIGFCLTRQRNALELLADLCFQSRMSLTWEEGLAKLHFLYNSAGTPTSTLQDSDIAESSLLIDYSSLDDIITEITAMYLEAAEEKKRTVSDATAELSFGRRVREYDFWSHINGSTVHSIISFWLERWKHVYTEVTIDTMLTSLEVQCGDTVELNKTDFYSSQNAYVIEVMHDPGEGVDSNIDNINLKVRLPKWAGCELSCEMECETGCESTCEIGCQSTCETGCEYVCESECQVVCEIICESTCELSCTEGCEMSCTIGCEVGCEESCTVACQSSCETDCESGCEVGCQTSCESECESECEAGCESGCETVCETGCEVSCETTCETGCQTACQESCQTDCEVSCQTTCQYTSCETACQTGCEIDCQSACQSECETGCQTSCQESCEINCQGSCQWDCQTGCEGPGGGCQTSCQTSCEINCQTGCEGASCQAGCESWCETSCETGCEDACQMQCEISCEVACTTECEMSCQAGCEVVCEGGCQSGCEVTCEGSCTTECEMSCQGGCQFTCETDCQGACELSCETSCEVSCETGCESSCETGCESGCQVTCESECQSMCEIVCETGCETGCESGCQTACETSCETGCESSCETGCETSGESSEWDPCCPECVCTDLAIPITWDVHCSSLYGLIPGCETGNCTFSSSTTGPGDCPVECYPDTPGPPFYVRTYVTNDCA